MKKTDQIGTLISGVIWVTVGIILDFAIQLGSTYSKYGIVKWLHVDKNNPIGITVMLLVAAILTALTVWI